jgi:hypothetical protein
MWMGPGGKGGTIVSRISDEDSTSQGSGAFYRLSTDTIHMPGSRNNPLHSRIDAQFSAHGGAFDL